ncbi:hypothetical protein Fmac_000071 [Flemingia macrophylla]|uniref:Small auxin up regulated protein n=1 Tax=Flemingia macrophylla TaxID=520843 RepID=A0ABD1NDB8_9FABA
MGFRLPGIRRASKGIEVPKGYLPVYVGDKRRRLQKSQKDILQCMLERKRRSFLNEPLFRELLSQAEEEFGYYHAMGGLTIPCKEDVFLDTTSHLERSHHIAKLLIHEIAQHETRHYTCRYVDER